MTLTLEETKELLEIDESLINLNEITIAVLTMNHVSAMIGTCVNALCQIDELAESFDIESRKEIDKLPVVCAEVLKLLDVERKKLDAKREAFVTKDKNHD